MKQKRTKYNEDMQGIFEFEYKSIIDKSDQIVKVDIRIESTLQKEPKIKNIIAIYQDPISFTTFFQEHTIRVMDLDEIFAEKTRAALTRKEPAIRDFFDIHYALQK
ncbi:MAG: nucleotidyl transferase AbiEii/AbiGii toxin family protein [bacterium]|nr:nucleotidyl transferase AbiEii/AbiGii toxin family protein [bacterium]